MKVDKQKTKGYIFGALGAYIVFSQLHKAKRIKDYEKRLKLKWAIDSFNNYYQWKQGKLNIQDLSNLQLIDIQQEFERFDNKDGLYQVYSQKLKRNMYLSPGEINFYRQMHSLKFAK